jgi:predicted nucleic acid-binding protein
MRTGQAVFVDTSAWFALTSPRDTSHAAAIQALYRLTRERRPMVTTNHVISESYTLVRQRLGFRAAYGLLERLRSTALVQRTFVPETWEEEAERLLEQYDDQPFSYVDATSFVAMRRLRIQEAFAFDRHFLIAGFALVGDQ